MIVESNTKAKTIQKYFKDRYHVIATNGHLLDLDKKRLSISIKDYTLFYKNVWGKKSIIAKIKNYFKICDKNIIIATDNDREGEIIAYHLLWLLKIDIKNRIRLNINDLSKTSIVQGITKLNTINLKLVEAQQARRFLDRYIGYLISPLLSRNLIPRLSAGRVQNAILNIIYNREQCIKYFVPKWRINIIFNLWFLGFNHYRCIKEEACKDIKDAAWLNNYKIKLEKIRDFNINLQHKKLYKMSSIKPFKTSTVQTFLFNWYGFSAKKTMYLLQKLYEGVKIKDEHISLITYIRTDSIQTNPYFTKIVRKYIEITYGKDFVKKNNIQKKTIFEQGAHECIRPIDLKLHPNHSLINELEPDLIKVYDSIYRWFLASFISSPILNHYKFNVYNKNVTLHYIKKTIWFMGYLNIYNVKIEQLIDDDTLQQLLNTKWLIQCLKNVDIKTGFSKPLPRFNEGSLIHYMSQKNIGWPSTYAVIIDKLLSKKYIIGRNKFKITTLGTLVNIFLKYFFFDLSDEKFTSYLETSLKQIEEDAKTKNEVLSTFCSSLNKQIDVYKKFIKYINQHNIKIDKKCKLCNTILKLYKTKFGFVFFCDACKKYFKLSLEFLYTLNWLDIIKKFKPDIKSFSF